MPPDISLIIPVYNAERFLAFSLDSALCQTASVEIICIHDGSTDTSLEILHQYAEQDDRIHVVDLGSNHGLSAARNVGIRQLHGTYTFFLDADDLLIEPTTLENMLACAREDNVDIVFGQTFYMDNATKRYWHYFPPVDEERPLHGVLPQKNPHLVNFVVWNKLIRSAFLVENNIFFDESLLKYEDADFSCQLFLHARTVSYIPVPTYLYRQSSDNSSLMSRKLVHSDAFYRIKSLENVCRQTQTYANGEQKCSIDRKIAYTIMGILFDLLHAHDADLWEDVQNTFFPFLCEGVRTMLLQTWKDLPSGRLPNNDVLVSACPSTCPYLSLLV